MRPVRSPQSAPSGDSLWKATCHAPGHMRTLLSIGQRCIVIVRAITRGQEIDFTARKTAFLFARAGHERVWAKLRQPSIISAERRDASSAPAHCCLLVYDRACCIFRNTQRRNWKTLSCSHHGPDRRCRGGIRPDDRPNQKFSNTVLI